MSLRGAARIDPSLGGCAVYLKINNISPARNLYEPFALKNYDFSDSKHNERIASAGALETLPQKFGFRIMISQYWT